MAQMNIANALSGAVALPEKEPDQNEVLKDPAFMAAMGQALQGQAQPQPQPQQSAPLAFTLASGNGGEQAPVVSGQAQVAMTPQAQAQVSGNQLKATANFVQQSVNPTQSRNPSPINQVPGAEALRTDARLIGSTTAASMAGLKPWNSQWVMSSNDVANPNLKPLFGESEAVQNQTQNSAQAAALIAALAQAGNQQPSTGVPNGEPVSRSQKQTNQDAMDIRMAGLMAMQTLRPEAQALSGMTLSEPAMAQLAQMNQIAQAPGQDTSVNSDSVSAEADLSAKLAALNGSVIASQPGTSEIVQGAPKAAMKQLSGAEFLDTLSGVNASKGLRVMDGGAQAANGLTANMSKAGLNASSEALKSVGTNARKLKLVEGMQAETGLSKDALANAASAGVGAGVLAATVSAGEKSSTSSMATPVVTGNVVQGSGGRDQLTSESLLNISNQVRSLGANGGGEMRVRLNPDTLGELHLKITAEGRNVSIEVQAKDDRAKKIIEDGMTSLKDGLAAQNLTLGKTEISVSSSFSSQMGHGQDFAGTHHQQSSHDSRGGDGWNQSKNESRSQNNENRAQAFARNNGSSNMQPRRAAPQGRLDVTA